MAALTADEENFMAVAMNHLANESEIDFASLASELGLESAAAAAQRYGEITEKLGRAGPAASSWSAAAAGAAGGEGSKTKYEETIAETECAVLDSDEDSDGAIPPTYKHDKRAMVEGGDKKQVMFALELDRALQKCKILAEEEDDDDNKEGDDDETK